MTQDNQYSPIPETVETLLDWKLPNESSAFSEEEFLSGVDQFAADMNSLFDRAFPQEAVAQ